MQINMIAAIGENNELGYQNELPWKIKEDLQYFKKITTGATVVMGRKTWDSLGRKCLPGRVNIVLTTDKAGKKQRAVGWNPQDPIFVDSIARARLIAAIWKPDAPLFFIGGASIYQEALPLVERLYLTIVQGSHKADVFFPEFDINAFERESEETYFTKEHIVTNLVLLRKEIHGKRESRAGSGVVRHDTSRSVEVRETGKIHWEGTSSLSNGSPRTYDY